MLAIVTRRGDDLGRACLWGGRDKKTQNRADEKEKAQQALGRFGPTQDEATKQVRGGGASAAVHRSSTYVPHDCFRHLLSDFSPFLWPLSPLPQLVEHVKRLEVSTAQSLGYNPYQAQLGSSTAAKAMIEMGAAGEVPPMMTSPLPPLPPVATSSPQPPGGHSRVSSLDSLPPGGAPAMGVHVDQQVGCAPVLMMLDTYSVTIQTRVLHIRT